MPGRSGVLVPELVERVDQVSGRLENWLGRSAYGIQTRFVETFGPSDPSQQEIPDGPRVEICFRALSRVLPARPGPAEHETFRVSYRVRAVGADPIQSQRLYSDIFFAACERDAEFTTDPTSDPGVSDGPFIDLAGLVERRVPAKRGPPVLGPNNVRLRGTTSLVGRVIDACGGPVARAEVSTPELGRRATTDADGGFAISCAPMRSEVRLRVSARGVVQEVFVKAGTAEGTTIELPLERDHA